MSKLAHVDIILKAKKLTMNVPLDKNPNNNVKTCSYGHHFEGKKANNECSIGYKP
jgi:hypothetical protein